MGWWPWSSSSPSGKNETQRSFSDLTQQQQLLSPHNQPPPPTPPPQKLSREEQADNELQEFLRSLESSSSSPSTQPENISSSSLSTPSPTETSEPKSINPDSLYPDTMSCRSAFDYAFFCQSFGGQWVNVYRYGELRSCSEHWENFWLCMKAQGFKGSDEARKEMIRDHYRKKAIKYKTGPSSEDVWEVRMEPLKGAFQGDFVAFEREMEQQEQQEREKQGQGNVQKEMQILTASGAK